MRGPLPILLVEDDADSRESLTFLLGAAGCTVVSVEHGLEALQQLWNGFKPCVILLDLRTPVMDGWEFRKEQLKDPEIASIPIVIYSGHPQVHAQATGIGAVACFGKPLDIDALMNFVDRYCETRCDVPCNQK